MPGTNCANRRRVNYQKLKRQKKQASHAIATNKVNRRNRSGNIVHQQHVKMLMSNPQSNVQLSSKKVQRLMQHIKLERKRLNIVDEECGADCGHDHGHESADEQDLEMEDAPGPGTTLGAPAS